MADRGLRFPLVSSWDGRGVNQGRRDLEKFRRDSGRTFDRAGTEHGRRYSGRLSKSLGGGFSASTGIVTRGAQLMGGALAAVGVAKLATDSVKMAATFDKTMRQTAAVAKVPQAQIKELRDVALDMGAKTSFSARQAGEAMLELGKGGLTFAQMKAGALNSTLTLAAAGGLELGEAAGFVVKGLTTFGLRADKAATVAAALAGGANASTASVQDLGLALSQVGPGARNAGLSIQETTGVLAAFSNSGIQGADAGTSLKTMLTRLVPTTVAAKTAMKNLGLSFVDSHGAMLPIPEIAARIQDKFEGLTDAERTRAMATIFGSDATRAATVLMNEGRAGIEKYIKATSDRAAAEKLAKTNTEGAAGAFERLTGAIETVQIKAGDKLLPLLADAATTIADRVLPAVERWVSAFARDLGPELGRMKQAWDDNKGSLLALVMTLAGSEENLSSTSDKAHTLADAMVSVTNFSGSAARGLRDMGDGLNEVNRRFEVSAQDIRNEFVVPVSNDFRKLAGAVGLEWIIDDVVHDFQRLSPAVDQHATTTDRAAAAGFHHVDALRAEKQAIDALKGALAGEETAELDVKQAKINVATAQARLTELTRGGRKGSLLYQQAQIDLRRAQIDLKTKTDAYKNAQLTANAATGGAMRAAQNARPPISLLGTTALAAGKRIVQMGLDAKRGINSIPNRSVKVTANYDTTAPRGIELLIEKGLVRRARGGPVWGAGSTTSDDIPALLSDQEHVWDAAAVKGAGGGSFQRGHRVLNAMRKKARGFARGGPALKVEQIGEGAFLARPGRFDRNIARSLDVAARGFGILVRQHKDDIFGGGKAEVRRFIQSMDPLPYIWGGAGPGGYDCSGAVGAAHLAHLGRAHGHGQRIYTTGSIRAGVMGLKSGLGGTLEIGVTPSVGHMVGRYGGKQGLRFEARSTRTGIFVGGSARAPEGFARHYHLAKGGPATLEELLASGKRLDIGGDTDRMRIRAGRPFQGGDFDAGGVIYPGLNVVRNRTGRPEALAPAGPPIDYRRLAQTIVDALHERPLVTYLDRQKVSRGVADGHLWEKRR